MLQCIVDDEGGNRKIDKKRGKLFVDANFVDLSAVDDDNYSGSDGPLIIDLDYDNDSIVED